MAVLLIIVSTILVACVLWQLFVNGFFTPKYNGDVHTAEQVFAANSTHNFCIAGHRNAISREKTCKKPQRSSRAQCAEHLKTARHRLCDKYQNQTDMHSIDAVRKLFDKDWQSIVAASEMRYGEQTTYSACVLCGYDN